MNDLHTIITAGIQAPTGDNCQPWIFRLNGKTIEMCIDLDRTHSVFNVKHIATFMGLGAALENMTLCARSFGLRVHYEIGSGDQDLLLRLDKVASPDPPPEYAKYIHIRRTNRCPYSSSRISDSAVNALESLSTDRVRVTIPSREESSALCKLMVRCDRLRWAHEPLVEELFSKIRFGLTDKHRFRDGLSCDTLGAGRFTLSMLRWLGNNDRVRRLNYLGLSRVMAGQTKYLLHFTGGLVALRFEQSDRNTFIEAGRIMQRMWLEATRLGLSLQPMASLPLLSFRSACGEDEEFSVSHRRLLSRLHDALASTKFDNFKGYPFLLFRIGHGPIVPAAVRKPVGAFLS